MLSDFLIVGGASAYAPGLVSALIQQSDRHDLEMVRLYDIAPHRLEIVERLCRQMSKSAGQPFRIEATTDRVQAVTDIDILLNSSRPGGFECRQLDEQLPLEFGIPGQETVGPGGFFFALRSIPAALALADDVARHAPEAIWLNYTNPTNIVGQALQDHTELEIIALCDQSDEDMRALADAMGYRDDVPYAFDCTGLNHATWYRDIRIDGDRISTDNFDATAPPYYDEEHRRRFAISAQMAERTNGMWPNSYLPYYEKPQEFVRLAHRVGTRTEAILEGLNDYYSHFAEQAERSHPELEHYRGSSGFGDMAADVLAALSSPTASDLVLNIPNRGLNPHFDDDTVVEAFAAVSQSGIERRPAPPLPAEFESLLGQLEIYQRHTAYAATTGDIQRLVQALASNPLVDDHTIARKMIERAPQVYGDALPQFDA